MRAGGQSGVEQGLSKQVAELFKANYKRPPWPDEIYCYPIAVVITNIRDDRSYRREFEQENRLRSPRRAVIQAVQRLIEIQKKNSELQLVGGLRLQGVVEDIKNLVSLAAALEQATPALLRPFDPFAGEREGAWWHKAARMIAYHAEEAVKRAGRKTVSFQKHGAFVKVIAAALNLAIGEDFEPETVAGVLKKMTY
jgi:hypothetical protein